MTLFLIRHAHAVDADQDPERPLSEKGRQQVRELATFLSHSGQLDAQTYWHSPLARSRQTAELLVERLKTRARLQEVDGIEGCHNPAAIVHRLEQQQSLAIVGHEPHLSRLATLLLCREATVPVVALSKCSVLALEPRQERWVVRWQVSPDLLGGPSGARSSA